MPEHQQTQKSTEQKPTSQKRATHTKPSPISNPMAIIQRAKINPKSLMSADILQLQRTIGNRAVGRLLSEIRSSTSIAQQPPIQRQEIPEKEETCPSCIQKQEIPEEEEPLQGMFKNKLDLAACTSCSESVLQRQEIEDDEKPLQGKLIGTIQRQEIPEEEEPLQGKMADTIQRQEISEEEEPLQGKFESKPEMSCSSCFAAPVVQKQELEEEEKTLQGKMRGTVQRQEIQEEEEPLQAKRENNTGMPDNLKAGVESLSGIDMSDVRVHYNSSKPAEVGALAYTQGTDIHVAPGQERHLPHEAWHVVQQAQRRVKPTMQLKRLAINDEKRLEREADTMGGNTDQLKTIEQSLAPGMKDRLAQFKQSNSTIHLVNQSLTCTNEPIQRVNDPPVRNDAYEPIINNQAQVYVGNFLGDQTNPAIAVRTQMIANATQAPRNSIVVRPFLANEDPLFIWATLHHELAHLQLNHMADTPQVFNAELDSIEHTFSQQEVLTYLTTIRGNNVSRGNFIIQHTADQNLINRVNTLMGVHGG